MVDPASGGRVKHPFLAALALLASAGAHAGGFVEAGIGAAWREPEASPLDLEYDTGTVARLEVGTQYDSGLQLRVGYTYTTYDTLTATGSLMVAEDIRQQDARVGVFYATPRGVPLGWRLGAGYAYADEDDNQSARRSQRGGLVEAAAVIVASRRVTLDLAAAVMKLGGKADYDAEAAELRATAAFHTRAMDFSVGARYALIDRDSPSDERLLELRVGVGGAWNYPEGASY